MDTAINVVNAVAGLPAILLYLVILAWLIAESAAVPLPCEAILLFAGFLIGVGHLSLPAAWIASITGTLGGASLAWWIARTFGPAGVRAVGRYVLLTPSRLAAAEGFFRRRGAATILIARLTPVVRTVISYPAGLAAMPYRSFLLTTALGCALYNGLILLLGRAAGQHWLELFTRFHTLAIPVGIAVLVAAIALLFVEHTIRKRLAGTTGGA